MQKADQWLPGEPGRGGVGHGEMRDYQGAQGNFEKWRIYSLGFGDIFMGEYTFQYM